MVDERGRRHEIGRALPDQRLGPDQVVLGREHRRRVARPGELTLRIVAARGEAVIADLSHGALVPRPA